MLNAWLREQRRQNLSTGTIDKRRSVAERLIAHAGRPLSEVTRDDIEAWLDSRPHNSARTRYCDISHLAAFYHWAIREDLLAHDPTIRIQRPKVRLGVPRPIASPDLRYALGQAPTDELRVMLELAAFQGMRCGEISALEAGDVLDAHDPPVLLVHGKGGKERVLPLHPSVAIALRRWSRTTRGPIFPDRPPWKVSAMIRGHLVDCGIAASGHQLRHWFATAAYEKSGGDLRMVQDLLGHSSPTTTAIYTRWSQTKAMVVVRELSV